MLRADAERRRAEARLRYLEIAQEWDEDGFWRRHAAEKGSAGGDQTKTLPRHEESR